MGYEGQIAGLGDSPAGKPLAGAVLRWMQRRSAQELAARRANAVAEVAQLAELEFVNGGGTGSIETTGFDDSVTEVAAGSGLIGPTLFDNYRRFAPRPAVLFALPVVRKPKRGMATLFGGGYIASGAAGKDRLPTPYLPAGLKLLGVEGAGEVQTPVTGQAARDLRVGDRVWLRHTKAGELAERFTEYHVIEGGEVTRPCRPTAAKGSVSVRASPGQVGADDALGLVDHVLFAEQVAAEGEREDRVPDVAGDRDLPVDALDRHVDLLRDQPGDLLGDDRVVVPLVVDEPQVDHVAEADPREPAAGAVHLDVDVDDLVDAVPPVLEVVPVEPAARSRR